MQRNREIRGQIDEILLAPSRLPKGGNGGNWQDSQNPGNCMWLFDMNAVPPQYNPNHSTWQQILQSLGLGNIQGILFQGGVPDFTPFVFRMTFPQYSDYSGKYTFSDDSPMTAKRPTNMAYGDREVAKHFDITQTNAKQCRSQLGLTWHEVEDRKTMLLVPAIIHGNVPHVGGVSAVKSGGIGAVCNISGIFEDFTYEQKELPGISYAVTVVYYTEASGAVKPDQYDSWNCFAKAFAGLKEQMDSMVDQYMEKYREMSEPDGNTNIKAADLTITDIIVYPKDEKNPPKIGILLDFPLDKGHGIGVLIGGEKMDNILACGPDSAAL